MHRILTRPATWVLASLALLVPAVATAKSPSVFVRVEGVSATLLPQTPVQTASTKKLRGHTCAGATAAGALTLATHSQWSGTWFSSFNDFEVKTILGETPPVPTDFWELWINGRTSSLGACATKLRAGDHELWLHCLADASGACSNDPLALSAPVAVHRGHKVTVKVTQLDAGGHGTPVAGAAINGSGVAAVTGAGGKATFVARATGELSLRAAKSGASPSDTKFVCVYPRRRSQCAAIRAAPGASHGRRSATASRAHPRIQVMVVGRRKTLLRPRGLKLRGGTVAVGKRRCTVPARTALAALLATRLKLRVTDRSGCDPAAMFVTRLGGDANRGVAGWEYKVGRADPSFGAADPSGRLRGSKQLLWYWCVHAGACQRTLAVTTRFAGSSLHVRVRGYDDTGHGVAVSGATVHYGSAQTQLTDANGSTSFAVIGGIHQLYASKPGLVRSFPTTVGAVP